MKKAIGANAKRRKRYSSTNLKGNNVRGKIRPLGSTEPSYKAVPVNTFRRMLHQLSSMEQIHGSENPITVGILIADCARKCTIENVLPQLDNLDRKSGELIDFYLPGYVIMSQQVKQLSYTIELEQPKYRFSRHDFDQFIHELEQRGIKVSGKVQLILVPYEKHRLWFNDALVLNIEDDLEANRIESVKLFLEFIIDISKSTTEFEEFKKKVFVHKASNRTLVLEFIKECIKNLVPSVFAKIFPK